MKHLNELIIDSFAGGGGASTGIELALGRIVNIAINHDIKAIQMHQQNHPYTKHYCENVFEVDPIEATQGQPVGLFWLSPDCTHFSKAKGSKPVKKEIRGLAWIAVKWAAAVKPRVIMLENVEEFKTWGPIKNGQPIKERKGETFKQFVSALQGLGYEVDWRELRACDYGAPTMRKRFFLIARCDGKEIVWSEPTHGNTPSLLPYRTAAECIDLTIPCKSIFDRKKPLSENTLKRIARGLEKFVFNNPKPFIVQIGQTGFGGNNRSQNIDAPLTTICRKNEHCLVTPVIADFHFENKGNSINEPLTTITSVNTKALIAPTMVQVGYGENKAANQQPRCLDLKRPIGTITPGGNKFALCTAFLSQRFGNRPGEQATARGSSLNKPLPTITATDHNTLITANFISRQFGTSTGHKLNEPLATITNTDKSRLVQAFLIKYFGQGTGQNISEPLGTITTKDRFGLVTVEGVDYQIVDIGMRMLEPRELYAAQGFPSDYKIAFDVSGKPYSKTDQVARCGNSVCPQVVSALVRNNLPELIVSNQLQTMAELQRIVNMQLGSAL